MELIKGETKGSSGTVTIGSCLSDPRGDFYCHRRNHFNTFLRHIFDPAGGGEKGGGEKEREEGGKGKGEGGARENYQSNIDLKKDPFDNHLDTMAAD